MSRALSDEATKILRKAGFTWSGRRRASVDGNQYAFERKMVTVCTRGQSRRKA